MNFTLLIITYRSHEWCKHGTCAVAAGVSRISDQRSFFSTTLSLFEMHDIAGSLANMGIVPATNTTYPVQHMMVLILNDHPYIILQVDKILSAFQMRPKLDCTTVSVYIIILLMVDTLSIYAYSMRA